MNSKQPHERILGQHGLVLWLTGLSGAGKTTLARATEAALLATSRYVIVLDGDELRTGLTRDLRFSAADRDENVRRTAEVARLLADHGVIVLVALISPYAQQRQAARTTIGTNRFLEVFVDAPLSECERRDPKRLYEKARSGAVTQFTGITAPYEPPTSPDLTVRTAQVRVEDGVAALLDLIRKRGTLSCAS